VFADDERPAGALPDGLLSRASLEDLVDSVSVDAMVCGLGAPISARLLAPDRMLLSSSMRNSQCCVVGCGAMPTPLARLLKGTENE